MRKAAKNIVYYKDEQLRYWSILAALTHMFNHVNTELMQATQEILSEQLHFNFTEKKSTKTIYTLTDPRDGKVFYVGATKMRLTQRLRAHIDQRDKEELPKYLRVRDIVNSGYRPIIEPLEESFGDDWVLMEQYWISQFRAWGFDLTNKAIGGHSATGCEPWNKGIKGSVKPNRTSFKKGHKSDAGFKKGNIPWNKSHLTDEQRVEIVKKYKPLVYTASMLAKEYNVPRSLIKNICRKAQLAAKNA